VISTKKHPFWIRGSQVMPKTPKFCWFGAKMGLTDNFTRNDILSYVSTFYGFRTSKQCDLHLQTPFFGVWFWFYCPIAFGPGTGPAHANVSVLTFTWNISCSRIFPNKLSKQSERLHPRECRKIVIWMSHSIFFFFCVSPLFFFTFFKIKNFWFICILGAPKWIKIFFFVIFYKFGMYLSYKKWFWAHFSWFLGRGIYSTVWTRSGSKIKKQVLVFKGLREVLWVQPSLELE